MTGQPSQKAPTSVPTSREEIMEAAAVIVADIGADAFTTGALADRSGVPLGMVYRHFADRFHVLDALRAHNGALLIAHVSEMGLAPHPALASAQIFHGAVVDFYRTRGSARHLRPGGSDDDAWWWSLASTMHVAVGTSDRRATLRACRLHLAMVHASFVRATDGDAMMLTQALRAFCFLMHSPEGVRGLVAGRP